MKSGASMAILVCTRNRARMLEATLTHLDSCDLTRVARVIVVDNASDDDTQDTLRRIARAQPRLNLTQLREPRAGVAHARRTAIRATEEPLIAFLDDDVRPAHDWATAIAGAFDTNPRAGAIGSCVRVCWPRPPSHLARACSRHLAHQDLGLYARNLTKPRDDLVAAALGLRRHAVEESGWLARSLLAGRTAHDLAGGEDAEMCIRIRRAGWSVRYEPQARCEHVIHPERVRRHQLARLVRDLAQSDPWLRWIAEGEPSEPDWILQTEQRLTRALRRSRLLEWRPDRRLMRINDRAGRLAGLRSLRRYLQSTETTPPRAEQVS